MAFFRMPRQISWEKTDQSRTEMKQPNPTVDDPFERARRSFFGTEKRTMNPSASPADFQNTRNDAVDPVSIQPTNMPHERLSQSSNHIHVEKAVR